MNTLDYYLAEYLEYCKYRKRLDQKTLKAYKIDMTQYQEFSQDLHDHFTGDSFTRNTVDAFITHLLNRCLTTVFH